MTGSIIVLVCVILVAILVVAPPAADSDLTRAVVGPVLVASVIAMAFAAVEAFDSAWSTAFGASLLVVPANLELLAGWLVPAGRAIVPLGLPARHVPAPRALAVPCATISSRLSQGDAPRRWTRPLPRTSRTASWPTC